MKTKIFCWDIVFMISGSIDLLDDTSSDESFDDGKPISKSLTLYSSDDVSDD